jgi:membrane-associated phospholipid phosphatase
VTSRPALGALLVAGALVSGEGTASAATPTPVDALGPDLAADFTGYNLFFYGGAVAATGLMAFGGADQAIREGVDAHVHRASAYGNVAVYTGYIAPVLVAPGVYLLGLALRDPMLAGAGSAAVQSLVVAMVATAALKVGVGRAYPGAGDGAAVAHQLRPFQSLDLPIGPAWPSGHTVAMTSVVAALTGFYPDQAWIPLVGYPLALAVGAGLVVGGDHWASDVIAGALLGHAIGFTTGRAFRHRLDGHAESAGAPAVVALAIKGGAGLALEGAW